METESKKSPLASQTKRHVEYEDEQSRFRAITEDVEGIAVRRLRGYPILFGVLGKPRRGSEWVEKVDKDALAGVDLSKLVLLMDHNTTWVLGRNGKNMRAVIDNIGLFIEVTLSNTWFDDYVYDRVEKEIIDGMSFYFDSKAIIATDWTNKLDVIVKINEVYEVSLLAFPAYDETVVIAEEVIEAPADPNDEAMKAALQNLIQQL